MLTTGSASVQRGLCSMQQLQQPCMLFQKRLLHTSPELVTCSTLCSSRCACRYLVAEAPASNTIFVAFMGTKVRRDLAANANVIHEPVWPEDLQGEAAKVRSEQVYTSAFPSWLLGPICWVASSSGQRWVLSALSAQDAQAVTAEC